MRAASPVLQCGTLSAARPVDKIPTACDLGNLVISKGMTDTAGPREIMARLKLPCGHFWKTKSQLFMFGLYLVRRRILVDAYNENDIKGK